MNIALYQPWIYLHGGIERSIVELVQRSRHEWTIYTGHFEPENTFPEFKDLNVIELTRLSVKRDIFSVLTVGVQIFFQTIPLDNVDALVIWCDGMGDLAVFRNHDKPIFNICSTPLRPVFDPVYIQHALSVRPLHSRLFFQLFKALFSRIDRLAWKKYAGVIATSKEVKQRILDGRLYRNDGQLEIYYPGINWQDAEKGDEASGETLLIPGRIMWSKNIELAIRAFLQAELPAPWKLIIAGFVDKKSTIYLQDLKTLASGCSRIIFVESPTDKRMKELYHDATVVLFPPLNEDWGIVPLEAMACARPVIANNSGGPAESIRHEETGWLLEPTVDAWSNQLQALPYLRDEVKKMGNAARLHSRQYDWSRFANGIDTVLETWCAGASRH